MRSAAGEDHDSPCASLASDVAAAPDQRLFELVS